LSVDVGCSQFKTIFHSTSNELSESFSIGVSRATLATQSVPVIDWNIPSSYIPECDFCVSSTNMNVTSTLSSVVNLESTAYRGMRLYSANEISLYNPLSVFCGVLLPLPYPKNLGRESLVPTNDFAISLNKFVVVVMPATLIVVIIYSPLKITTDEFDCSGIYSYPPPF